MSTSTASDVYYDPYDVAIDRDPYPTFKRLRDEAPLYYNEPHDFYAVSRYADVERCLLDRDTYISGRGGILELIKSGIEMPPGVVIFEDPPTHTIHRGLLSRVFTPRKVAALEPKIRQLCADALDPFVGAGGFDIVGDLGAVMPMRVIGMLLGIPEEDQIAVRNKTDDNLRTVPGQPMQVREESVASGELFVDYIEWRAKHPADDLMTQLLNAEFEDEHGEKRKLTRQEVLTYTSVIAGAGNETTGRLIGWLAKLLAEHPDQRRQVVEDRSLLPRVIDETLRFEPTGHSIARLTTKDVELHGTTIPAESPVLIIVASANRDPRRYENPDVFDIHRDNIQHLTFGFGLHFCLGASLARLEGRVALDELLNRWPEWDVDYDGMELFPTSTVRGWASMPLILPS